jgi:hypothetical protein
VALASGRDVVSGDQSGTMLKTAFLVDKKALAIVA